MAKKVLKDKSGDGDLIHDTSDQIQKCLSCTKRVCINCVAVKTPYDMDDIDYDRPLLPGEKAVLAVYAICGNDKEISAKTGISVSKCLRYRKQLGLPPATIVTSEIDRQAFVDLWIRK